MNDCDRGVTAGNGKHFMSKSETDIDAAQVLALQALAYFASEPATFMRFAEATGLGRDEVAANAASVETQAAVLDYLMRGEHDLMAFCDHARKTPQEVFWALHALDPHAMTEMPQGLMNKSRPAVWRR